VAELSIGLTKSVAATAPKVFQLNKRLGAGTVVKLLVVVVRAFIDSVRVPDKPSPTDVLLLAEDLALTYTHDSIKDIVLALKEARLSGTKFYQALDASTIKRLIIEYFERKAAWLKGEHDDRKASGTSLAQAGVAQLASLAPAIAKSLTLRIDPNHPHAEGLRQKLSLTKQKLERGLIDETEAARQRAEVAAAATRKPRDDWKPSAGAQQRIEASNRREDKRILDKYPARPQLE